MEGLWTVEFGSSAGISGGGVAVFSGGTIRGGDGGYYYIGKYTLQSNTFQAEVTVSPFIPNVESVFRTLGRTLNLHLVGSFTDRDHAIAQGQAEGLPNVRFGAKLTKRA